MGFIEWQAALVALQHVESSWTGVKYCPLLLAVTFLTTGLPGKLHHYIFKIFLMHFTGMKSYDYIYNNQACKTRLEFGFNKASNI